MVKPRSYWFNQEDPGIYQELKDSTRELRPEVPGDEYSFPNFPITNILQKYTITLVILSIVRKRGDPSNIRAK